MFEVNQIQLPSSEFVFSTIIKHPWLDPALPATLFRIHIWHEKVLC